ncbi:hypothetical protein BC834DRAFT_887139 [Gloeopeniophorella convolvens]|nr:hypothetical protein BC834DRAFT_887139 [Gloeopeniophorella convolvens]
MNLDYSELSRVFTDWSPGFVNSVWSAPVYRNAFYWQVYTRFIRVIEQKLPSLCGNLASLEQFKANVAPEGVGFFTRLMELAHSGRLGEMVASDVFMKPKRLHGVEWGLHVAATLDGWNAPFVDRIGVLKALEDHVSSVREEYPMSIPCCAIVGPFGTGKSRLLDEFAKGHFVIPISLRWKYEEVFPPSDRGLWHFFASMAQNNTSHRMCAFLASLFDEAARVVGSFNAQDDVERIHLFREWMMDGRTMGNVGPRRKLFYENVMAKAEEVPVSNGMDIGGASRALYNLEQRLESTNDAIQCNRSKLSEPPRVFLAFDDTLGLFKNHERIFTELLLKLEELSHRNRSLFSFFVSPIDIVWHPHPSIPGPNGPSRTVQHKPKMCPPFTAFGPELPLVNHNVGSTPLTIEDVTSTEYIVHIGRPLWGARYDNGAECVRNTMLDFAKNKLLDDDSGGRRGRLIGIKTLAVLSQRLALETNGPPPNQVSGVVCLTEGDNHVSMNGYTSIAPSFEPILAEAASSIMSEAPPFNLPQALLSTLDKFSVVTGPRGELFILALLTAARDRAAAQSRASDGTTRGQLAPVLSVARLLSALFVRNMSHDAPSRSRPEHAGATFDETFRGAAMHFNHFAPVHAHAAPDLLAHLARGAAALGVPGCDAALPFVCGTGGVLARGGLGAVLVCVASAHADPRAVLAGMDPGACVLDPAVPVVRIVFVLGAARGGRPSHCTRVAFYNDAAPSDVTTFDYWCVGVAPDVLRPVGEDPAAWVGLAQKWDRL